MSYAGEVNESSIGERVKAILGNKRIIKAGIFLAVGVTGLAALVGGVMLVASIIFKPSFPSDEQTIGSVQSKLGTAEVVEVGSKKIKITVAEFQTTVGGVQVNGIALSNGQILVSVDSLNAAVQTAQQAVAQQYEQRIAQIAAQHQQALAQRQQQIRYINNGGSRGGNNGGFGNVLRDVSNLASGISNLFGK